jgi:NAD-dependent deacetylase
MPSIVVLTGAGISKESGLDTFRDAGGIWSKVRLDDVATPEAFRRDPARVQAFYNSRRRALLDPAVQPNAAHRALAHLEQAWPDTVLLVTQNVDDLHDRAGSRNLIHMHGELLKARCGFCTHVADIAADITDEVQCRGCGRAGGLRPHVVWFGEIPLELERIDEALAACGFFISIGTSGTVYPAARYVRTARAAGARTVELNLEPSEGSLLFDVAIHGPASAVVPDFVARLLAEPR